MRVLPPLAALLLGATTALLVACGGGDGRIPAGDASSLTSALNQISSNYRSGNCVAAQRAVAKAQNAVLALPDTVDARLRQRLQSGIQNLAAKVPATCSQTQTQTQQTQTDTGTTDTATTDTATTDTGTTDTGTTGTDVNITDSTTDLFDATNVASTVDLSAKKGWFVTLRTGEKVINGPVVVASEMFFGTNQPCASGKLDDNDECSSSGDTLSCTGNLGIARRYDINFLTAQPSGFTNSSNLASRSEIAAGGGFLPTPVSGVVEIDGTNHVFLTDNPLNPGGVINPHISVTSKRFRTYWHAVIE